MNDPYPSGTMTTPTPASDASTHHPSYGSLEAQYGDSADYGYDTGAHTTTHFETDPLFGSLPGENTGSYDAGQWSTGNHQTLNYDAYAAQHHAAHDTGAYDTTNWTGEHHQLSAIPPQAGAADVSGHWDANAWLQPDQRGNAADQTQHWEWGTQTFDTGTYDATQWNSDGAVPVHQEAVDHRSTAVFEQVDYDEPASHDTELSATGELPALSDDAFADDTFAGDDAPLLDGQEDFAPAPGSRMAARNAGRSRRRTPPKRSALMKIAVPSACVMGVTGIAAASVGGLSDDQTTSAAAADVATKSVQPSAANNTLDTQLESLSAGADDFADRASRTQERIDLKAQQVAEQKKAAEEAARKERLRPKFALPVAQHGLSAYYGQAGVNWMSVHTGIDFPVSYGTTVMAATDGTVRTQWNSAYGNMMIVTAKDGTETWYCHLSTYRVASGTTVKAGDPIAYSGNSGNSTGPHLHFEVRPAGGSAIDPLPWLRSHGLDPT
ncbi:MULTISPECIES: peptidoglycan DD-metalloendopeptidase family protein [unclassified Streptomyces]|uniref:M23 family metallopeptidase n=1 Tax=unclassified Streptomyces TaxID=2593676 RepID=UPI0036EF7EFE